MSEWINVKDRLPESGTKVLAFGISNRDYTEIPAEARSCEYAEWDYSDQGGKKAQSFGLLSSGCGCCDREMIEVTHWMSLPEPPK